MQPLVPADVDLRGMPWMPLDTVRLIDSDLFALSTGDEFKAAVALWCKSWTQQPAASLPSDDRILAHLSGAGQRWKKIKAMALRGWLQCDDGRLYHPVIAQKALEAWEQREEYQERQDNEKTRLQQFRAEHKALRRRLREHGIVLPFDTKIDVLRERAETLPETPPETKTETQTETEMFQFGNACNAPATAKTETGTGRETEIKDQEHPLSPSGGGDSADAEPRERSRRSPRPSVPYEDIVAAYRQLLPQLAQPKTLSRKRKTAMDKAWALLPERHRLPAVFRAIFAECAQDPFLNGTGPYRGEHSGWEPTFDYLIREDVVAKVYEKAMHRREQQRQQAGGVPTGQTAPQSHSSSSSAEKHAHPVSPAENRPPAAPEPHSDAASGLAEVSEQAVFPPADQQRMKV